MLASKIMKIVISIEKQRGVGSIMAKKIESGNGGGEATQWRK
jgi:hypothetical protein